jgi:hypothetical protein
MEVEEKPSIVSEEDKLIIGYLIDRQSQIDSFYDTQNKKISQLLTINVVVFGAIVVIIDNLPNNLRNGYNLGLISISLGIIFIIISTIIGIIAYQSFSYDFGILDDPKNPKNLKRNLKKMLYSTDNFSSEERIKFLKDTIIENLNFNLNAHDKKEKFVYQMLNFDYLGIILLFLGYLLIFLIPHLSTS